MLPASLVPTIIEVPKECSVFRILYKLVVIGILALLIQNYTIQTAGLSPAVVFSAGASACSRE